MTPLNYQDLLRHILLARITDEQEESLINRGEAFFSVSGAGHESTAALAPFLNEDDWLYLHYRDKALMMARGLTPKDFLLALLCRKGSHSDGRQMSAHMSNRKLNIVSLSAPMGNNALHAAGSAATIKNSTPNKPIVVHGLGDGTTGQGEVLEAIAEAARSKLPVLFLIHDNDLAISTRTKGSTFFNLAGRENPESFHGVPITYADGWDWETLPAAMEKTVADMRETSEPHILIIRFRRLASHTNADDQKVYVDEDEMSKNREKDPLIKLREFVLAKGLMTSDELESLEKECRELVQQDSSEALDAEEPTATTLAKKPLTPELEDTRHEYLGDMKSEDRLTMLESIRGVLRHQLVSNEKVLLYGEDLRDPKGDVFGITRGLTELADNRVINSALTESTIAGVAIGRALAGEKPVAFLQFADFYPLAFNQILSELGSYWWRTLGDWQCPVIFMITCGGYRPGLGPFHAQTMDSFSAHIPGVDVMMPSTAGDAAALLNSAFKSDRPTLFFYPKNLLNDKALGTSPDLIKHQAAIGKARTVKHGQNLTMVGWGNTVPILKTVSDTLEKSGITSDIIDLRCLSPWDRDAVVNSVRKTGHLLVSHEDNLTGGFGGEVIASVTEALNGKPLKAIRVARPDTHVPCHFPSQLELLPSYRRTIEAAAKVLDIKLDWPAAAKQGDDDRIFDLEAIGSSPSDESITVLEWRVGVGDRVEEGQNIADMEADKAVLEYYAPVAGKVHALVANEGDTVPVGAVIAQVEIDTARKRQKAITREKIIEPTIIKSDQTSIAASVESPVGVTPILCEVTIKTGSRVVPNSEIGATLGVDDEFIISRSGIKSRFWVTEEESAITLGRDAVLELLTKQELQLSDIDLLICTTTTPPMNTPSLACQILGAVSDDSESYPQAYDISAACSGYIFALQQAYDVLHQNPKAKILIVTSEVLSTLLDHNDPGTAIIFGDAATATLVVAESEKDALPKGCKEGWLMPYRPLGSTEPDTTGALNVSTGQDGRVSMDGKKVFTHAVRRMTETLKQLEGIEQDTGTEDYLLVAHQANVRILQAIAKRMKLEDKNVFLNLDRYGNTSSSTIPLCLSDMRAEGNAVKNIYLCAFGGGYTWGGTIIKAMK